MPNQSLTKTRWQPTVCGKPSLLSKNAYATRNTVWLGKGVANPETNYRKVPVSRGFQGYDTKEAAAELMCEAEFGFAVWPNSGVFGPHRAPITKIRMDAILKSSEASTQRKRALLER
jgi:hypothetical protein